MYNIVHFSCLKKGIYFLITIISLAFLSVFLPSSAHANSTSGAWSSLVQMPLVAVHMSLLPNGNILVWDGWETPNAYARVWNPSTNNYSDVFLNSGIFCSGHAFLPDGRLLVMGGHSYLGTEIGIQDVNIFNFVTNTWEVAPSMNAGRWYPTVITLGDGRSLFLGGQITNNVWQNTPEIYDSVTNTTTLLSSVNASTLADEYYPNAFVLPNGNVFAISPNSGQTGIITPNSWVPSPPAPTVNGSGVMYRPGKILYTGGSQFITTSNKTSGVIDLTSGTGSWRQTQQMQYGRWAHNLIVLPDGNVLVVGGATTTNNLAKTGVLQAEMWSANTETWTTMASMQDPRMYHSTAILMPDARVLVAGGGQLGDTTNYKTAQFYSPPYLFKGARPIISNVSSTVGYNANFTIDSPEASNIQTVSLVRHGSNTHFNDTDQRFVPLSFTKSGMTLTVTSPQNGNIAPPGYYMLFILNSQGVPSVARTIRVGGATPNYSCTNPRPGQLAVFRDVNFSGICEVFMENDSQLSDNIVGDNQITSLKLGAGLSIRLCNGENYQGTCETFNSSDADLRDNSIGNDTASSLDGMDVDPSLPTPTPTLTPTPGSSCANPTTGKVAFFSQIGYGGTCEIMSASNPDLRNSLIGNDTVSSLRLGQNTTITLCAHLNFGAPCETFTNSDNDLRNNVIGDDSVTSVSFNQIAGKEAVLCEHINFGGVCETFTTNNDSDLRDNIIKNDNASSIKVTPGTQLTLCEHINYGGKCEVFTGNDADLRNNLISNDNASSLKVD